MNAHGAAFPFAVPGGEQQRGITQRDLVAALAMQGLLGAGEDSHDPDKMLEKAFKIADAFVLRASRREATAGAH